MFRAFISVDTFEARVAASHTVRVQLQSWAAAVLVGGTALLGRANDTSY